jgi:uncharacterized protein YacL
MEYIQSVLLLLIILLLLHQSHPRNIIKKNNIATSGIIVDSSVLIDGRIHNIAETGFVMLPLVIPSSVLREMQYLADKGSSDKRTRARHGLDVVKQLQALSNISVTILSDGLPEEGGVDERLVMLCQKYSMSLLTLDFNLNKVAAAEGIEVLNINKLAQNLRMSYLPGEKRNITLMQKGDGKQQAVGYLEDGTMVVVDQAEGSIGSSVEVEFTRTIQTQSGRMMFAKLVHSKVNQGSAKKNYNKRSNQYQKGRVTPKSTEDSLVELANKR